MRPLCSSYSESDPADVNMSDLDNLLTLVLEVLVFVGSLFFAAGVLHVANWLHGGGGRR